MFTTPCFIRNNTPELREKLEKLGYHICSCTEFEDSKWLETFLKLDYPSIHGVGYWDETCPFEPHQALDFFVKENTTREIPSIDCGTNEEIFLALAALRDDTDKHQWFIDDNTGIWERSNDELPSRYMQMEGHKATVEEIIEHFTVQG